MKKSKTIIFEHDFPYVEGWTNDFVEKLNCEIIDDKQIVFPKKIASGGAFYTALSPDLFTMVVDLKLNKNFQFSRNLLDDEPFVILYYDLSEDTNKIIIEGKEKIVGSKPNVRFSILDSLNTSSYIAHSGAEIFIFRILVRKSFIEDYLRKNNITDCYEEVFKKIDDFQGRIDSKSKIRLYDLRRKPFNEPNYEIYLKGVALKLFWKFLNRIKNYNHPDWIFTEDHQAVIESEKTLVSNLTIPFPGVDHLAAQVNMSATKYKELFKKIFEDTPLHHFLNEKLSLARELLVYNKVKTVAELAEYLGYSSVSHFSALYKKRFGITPHESLGGNE